ncbi:MAG: ABC transporter ATP-binding protein [Candidatus Binataceae bacterium]|nr:ABC transporter ATP-binding protein [Candidatus Binataceae bacterium]
MPPTALVEAAHLRKSYGARLAVDDLTFSVKAGEVVGLLGPNGAGKTTTLSMLATLIAPDAGEVRIAGFDSRVAPDRLRRRLGFVPQSIALYPPLSAFQNVEVFARLQGLTRPIAQARSSEALEAVGLGDRADDPVWSLSGGMQRRLNLACGMVHRPEALLLDEPTVGVDPQSRERIFTTIRAMAESGVAVLYSTHYMEEVERMCDRALLIDGGKLLAQGTVAQLIELGGRHPRMELTFDRVPRPGWHDGIAGVAAIAATLADGRVLLELANLGQIGELLERARNSGAQLLEFAVHSPNLSDAFIALTGRALRDKAAEN